MKRSKPLSPGKGLSRGKPLERGSSLQRGGPLGRGNSTLKRTGGPAPRSKKRAEHMRDERAPLVRKLVEAGVTCEIVLVFEELGIEHQCQRQISGMHERRKSSSGGSRVNMDNLIPACSWCNGYIEDAVGSEPGEDRYEIEHSYLVVREKDRDEWDRLSKRHDRTA